MPPDPAHDPARHATVSGNGVPNAEDQRLEAARTRKANWKRWGPYLSERQWGTVREDYSADGECWSYFTHEAARSRAYRWGEDGLLGWTDRQCRLCFALALWNTRDPILKERLYGLTGPEGNHGEDVKERYFYLDSTPTYSYYRALYQYPQAEFPYETLARRNAERNRDEREFELEDTGIFDDNRFWDVQVEYAKSAPNDTAIQISVTNRGPERAVLHLLPTLWYRNTWTWGCVHEGCDVKPFMEWSDGRLQTRHATLGTFYLEAGAASDRSEFTGLMTENATNSPRLFQTSAQPRARYKDAFHDYVVRGMGGGLLKQPTGTKFAAHYVLTAEPGQTISVPLRLYAEAEAPFQPLETLRETIRLRRREADEFYEQHTPKTTTPPEREVYRQSYAGLLSSNQFYHYVVEDWLKGDPNEPAPPSERLHGRNSDWPHLFNRDVISVPDKWEYPWYAAWDLAFHMIPYARVDSDFAKHQLELMLREWYMHPNGQIPAYEFALGDVNPPVHAWACWRVYKMTARRGRRDHQFLARIFTKLLLNFTWWVNRKDVTGHHLFSGGFLGLDNIGVFDRSKPLPTGGHLHQADGTAWMAFYCATMLAIAMELALHDPTYEDIASKFFEHFVHIADAMNNLGGTGLWDEEDGFYYDQLHAEGRTTRLGVRSMVGVIPLFACEILKQDTIDRLPGFKKRMQWFLDYRPDLARQISYCEVDGQDGQARVERLLAIPSRERLIRVLRYVLDENEFLSPFGVRALSRVHREHPYEFWAGGERHTVEYEPGESRTGLFGGNSNWRGPVWFPVNYLLIESLERYHHFYGDEVRVECPTGSGQWMNLREVARELSQRLIGLFLPGDDGERPYRAAPDPVARTADGQDLLLFHEYFHGETGRGMGASHQTGWTALVAGLLFDTAQDRASSPRHSMV